MVLTYVEKAFILHFQDDWQSPLLLQEFLEMLEVFMRPWRVIENIYVKKKNLRISARIIYIAEHIFLDTVSQWLGAIYKIVLKSPITYEF